MPPQITAYPEDSCWSLRPAIELLPSGAFRITYEWSRPKAKIVLVAESPLELTTILHAIGTGRLAPRVETMEEFLARGGVITRCEPRAAAPTTTERLRPVMDLTLDQLLSDLA